ncbi:MAG: hypothetical protein HW401_845 [Parcubacteria group bacterium]|nr:hypothetical protein [Parcubacteria group bacterium]
MNREENNIMLIYFFAVMILSNLYFMSDTQERFYEMNLLCEDQLLDAFTSIHKKIDRNHKEIKHATNPNEKELELIADNLELVRENEKLMRELIRMSKLLGESEMPIYKPLGKVKI